MKLKKKKLFTYLPTYPVFEGWVDRGDTYIFLTVGLQQNNVTCCLTCSVCSIALGKFFNVQMGMDFSGGSCDEEYDSVMCGITTC